MRFSFSTLVVSALALAACSDGKRPGFDDPAVRPSGRDVKPTSRDAEADAPATPDDGHQHDASASGDNSAVASDRLTFTQVYMAVLRQKCSPCHTSTGESGTGIAQGQLDMSTQAKAHANLVNVVAQGAECKTPWNYVRVTPGDPDKSVLYQKLSPDIQSCGKKMPMDRSALSKAEVVLVADWIRAGAKND